MKKNWYKIILFNVVVTLFFACILSYLFEQPIKRYPHRNYPFLHRYTPNKIWKRTTYGDLAKMLNVSQDYQEIRIIEWKTDEYGFLNSRVKDHYDIIAIGDSYTSGSPINQAEMWPNVLSEISKLNVYNLGYPAEGPWHALMNWKIESHRFENNRPLWIIWGIFSGNDLDDQFQDFYDPPISYQPSFLEELKFFGFERIKYSPLKIFLAGRSSNRQNVTGISEKTFSNGRRMLFFDAYANRSKRTYRDIIQHPNFAKLKGTIIAFNKTCISKNIKLAIVLFPCKEEIYEWLYNDRTPWSTSFKKGELSIAIQEICESNNIIYLDLYQQLLASSISIYGTEQKSLWWYDDTHMNKAGNYIAALTIYQDLWGDSSNDAEQWLTGDAGRRAEKLGGEGQAKESRESAGSPIEIIVKSKNSVPTR